MFHVRKSTLDWICDGLYWVWNNMIATLVMAIHCKESSLVNANGKKLSYVCNNRFVSYDNSSLN